MVGCAYDSGTACKYVHRHVLSSLQRYLTALRKEKEAFHQLIREKGVSLRR